MSKDLKDFAYRVTMEVHIHAVDEETARAQLEQSGGTFAAADRKVVLLGETPLDRPRPIIKPSTPPNNVRPLKAKKAGTPSGKE